NKRISDLLERRSTREPLQYALGNTFFADLDLKLDARVFIPRPETEGLLQRILDEIETSPRRILDLGVGSGAIVLGLARVFPSAEAFAVDKSNDSLSLAEENAKRNGLQGSISFFLSDWFEKVNGKFDLIVSNPPYLDQEEWLACEPEVRDFEPKMALVSEIEDSAADLKRIIKEGFSRLCPGGLLALETGEKHHAPLLELALERGYLAPRGLDDLQGRPRYFFANRPA
ncbi:MAG: peptide chain release factor N(5)-glutamine methyltransferase, partial [Opitutales bacterium]